jgi:hypothetical protein
MPAGGSFAVILGAWLYSLVIAFLLGRWSAAIAAAPDELTWDEIADAGDSGFLPEHRAGVIHSAADNLPSRNEDRHG